MLPKIDNLYPLTNPFSEIKYTEYGFFLPNKLYAPIVHELCVFWLTLWLPSMFNEKSVRM